ncbi:MAG: GNAT family N-acetyltransferase [Chlorobia bacterium]|nr:GNAT family N-acetyltransferase [Fimbriimonadaceae bacterium]
MANATARLIMAPFNPKSRHTSAMIRAAGERLVLRDWNVGDLPMYREWLNPGHAWLETDAPYYPQFTPDEADEHVATFLENLQVPVDVPTRLVIARTGEEKLIGSVSRYWISAETHWMAIGIAIFDPEEWGSGVGFEAMSLWISFLFDAMPELARLDLQTWSGNVGMIKLAQKLGFSEEAKYRKARIVNAKYYDAIGFGVLREEWVG